MVPIIFWILIKGLYLIKEIWILYLLNNAFLKQVPEFWQWLQFYMKRVCNASTRIIHYRYYLLDIFFSLRSMILNLPKIYGFYMTSSQQKLNTHSVCQPKSEQKSVLYFCKRMSHNIHENWHLIPAIEYYSHLSPFEDINMYQQGFLRKCSIISLKL